MSTSPHIFSVAGICLVIAVEMLLDFGLRSLVVDLPIAQTVVRTDGLLGLENVFEYFSFGWLSLLLGSGSLWGSVGGLGWSGNLVFNGHFGSACSLLLLFKFLELLGKLLLG